MTMIIDMILTLLGMIIGFFFGLVIWPEKNLTMGQLIIGAFVMAIVIMFAGALGRRVSKIGGNNG